MPNNEMKQSKSSLPYQIKLKGHLRDDWTDWFGGLSISHDETGNTILSDIVVDQAQLHGLFKRIGDTGMELISVNPITETDDEITADIESTDTGDKK